MRFLISGYYGFDNLGDEAILAQTVAGLRTRWPLDTIEVLSQKPAETAHDFGVAAAPRADVGAVRRAIERSDVVISGGGGLLQNATSLKSLLYYAGIVRSAVGAGKRTMIFAQSIGPLDFWGKQTVRSWCSGVAAATVRDERSRELLAGLLPHVAVERGADPVFLYDLPESLPALEPFGLGQSASPLVIVAVRKTSRFDEVTSILAAAVDSLVERHGVRAAFIPFGGSADAEAATIVLRKCKAKAALVSLDGFDTVATAIAQASFVIGVRLHALVLAARFGVPFLAVAYDPKVQGLCEDLAYPLGPLWSAAHEDAPRALVDDAWARRDELAAHLAERVEPMRALAAQNFDVLARIVA